MGNGTQHLEEQYSIQKTEKLLYAVFLKVKKYMFQLDSRAQVQRVLEWPENLKRALNHKHFPIYLSNLISILTIHVGLEMAAFTDLSWVEDIGSDLPF